MEHSERTYCNNPKYGDWQAWATCVGAHQTMQNAASDQGLVCLPLSPSDFRQIDGY